jgi:uncharacterized membrane protein YdbT with pleckstrin-like domain
MDQTFQNGVYYSPGKQVLFYFVFAKLISIVIVFAIIGFGISFLHVSSAIILIMIAAGIASCGIAFLIGWMKYKNVMFMLDEFSFHVRKGILSKSEIAIPYKQIQNVNYAQSFNEKMWGIAHVTIETAGTDESASAAKSEGILPVLSTPLAVSLENQLLQKAGGK